MSFADELRKPYHKERNLTYAKRYIKNCLSAIQSGCNLKHMDGINKLSGEFWFDDSDYGTYIITSKGTYVTLENITLSDFNYIKSGVENGLREMGFTKFKVKINVRNQQSAYYTAILHRQKYENNGKKEAALYIEVEW
jgi:hypothetical protein